MAHKNKGTYDTQAAKELSLDQLKGIFADHGCQQIYIKKLSPNDNSKNQPYFGGHLTDIAYLPSSDIETSLSKSNKPKNLKQQIKYQASLDLAWIDAEGQTYPSPNTKLIYYPQYPETRFSGFLKGSKASLSEWMDPYKNGRSQGRWLILGVTDEQKILAYLVTPKAYLSQELEGFNFVDSIGVFYTLKTQGTQNKKSSRESLLERLKEIHEMGWISSSKLNTDGVAVSYTAQNGGGYTLEAQLGVKPNGIAEPDFLGWEVKQFGVTRFPRIGAKPTTLMTPEPTGGVYRSQSAIEFVKLYGYPDRRGTPDRLNFGGKHIADTKHKLTNLKLTIIGFNAESNSITDAAGEVALIDDNNDIAASWGFPKLMNHWKRKHSQAVYVPCLKQKNSTSNTIEYHYGADIELGTGTSFQRYLTAMSAGFVFYDPGIKLENVSSPKPKIKKRSQFRVNHKNLNGLYDKFEHIDLTQIKSKA